MTVVTPILEPEDERSLRKVNRGTSGYWNRRYPPLKELWDNKRG